MHRIDILPPEIELAQLLQRCAARDPVAFRALYDKTSPLLFARLLRMLPRPAAEQALRDVYLRISERAAQYQLSRIKPLPWMISIARYCAIDLLRHERLSRVDDAAEDGPAPFVAEAANKVACGGNPSEPDTCLGQLKPLSQQCLTLALVEGRSHEQIARITHHPVSGVKQEIRHGLLALRQCQNDERRHI
jgi:RNA polymerase sigma-70 factor (ECF subfamily)